MTVPNDRNVLEEVLERGTIRVSVGNAEATSGQDGFFLDFSRLSDLLGLKLAVDETNEETDFSSW